tara:strand:- start:1041 stop:1913 length:873 start_codon:yes stop_codon:yes gene_type:complete
MFRPALSTASIHLSDLLGNPWYQLTEDANDVELGPNPYSSVQTFEKNPLLPLIELPKALNHNGIHTVDLCNQHIPSIQKTYLDELRSEFESNKVELFQVLIDVGNVCSIDKTEQSQSMSTTKRWMEIASHLGATGVRYVPGDRSPTAETIAISAAAFTDLADYANSLKLAPATENWKRMTDNPEDLLHIIKTSNRKYGLIADFGNASGPNKFETLTQLIPHATSVHAWVELNSDNSINSTDFIRCLQIARDNNFDGPIMYLGGLPGVQYRESRDLWSGVDEMQKLVNQVF